ncbi:PREDICTED: C-type lectin domain family 4 member E [Dinoponera quadriceps]|uniref:C-type lectin domain family 4 member E n=1 Tax=Dinoponera quadriceps TaxID=609295 RepID=A0A6P3Y8L8_DINQU|nr:PREDICTED: C-type lectin domain family 4 member E [Dinoponera quadriceps]
MLIVSLSSLLLTMHAAHSAVGDRCCEINYHELPQYELIKKNSRSKQPIISRKVVSNVSECEQFAASKKSLAFNFVSARDRAGSWENTCQALQCPEDHNMTTLTPAANHKYYSMYPVFVPPDNTTVKCIPKAGVFLFSSDHLNYTQARTFCRERKASLAHVISEERTEGLARFVSPSTPRYVGLSNIDSERIWKNEFGEPLSCFDYRAWGVGQPSHSKGCVVLASSPVKGTPPSWEVAPCYISLPFICEVIPLPIQQRSSRRRHKQRSSR